MLTKFLANSFVGMLELLMWLVVVIGTLAGAGSEITGSILADAGIGFLLSLIFAAIFFGPIMMIVELKKSVSKIESKLLGDA